MKSKKILSIVIPFYNREHLISPLFENLQHFDFDDVEFVFVDDGSTDKTFENLNSLMKFQSADTVFLKQENKGPGGARNLGLEKATGEYVWFVDSDDGINKEAYFFLKENREEKFDFIDFNLKQSNIDKPVNSLNISGGGYSISDELSIKIKNNFGRLWTKIFRKEFLIKSNFYYPEYCIYEDNFIPFFLPFKVNKFIKSDIVGYYYSYDGESITRTATFNERYYGRLLTAHYGLMRVKEHITSQEELNIFYEKYVLLFYRNTIMNFIKMAVKNKDFVSNFKRILLVKSVMNNEREFFVKYFDGYCLPTKNSIMKKNNSFFRRLIFSFIDMIPNQKKYIKDIVKIHNVNWKKPIYFKDFDL